MNMKRVIIGAILALPLYAVTVPTQQASASEGLINPHVQSVASKPTLIALRHRVRVAGHYEGRGRYRRWVPAHYVYR
ncbi:MAG: hypothetical protein PUP93_33865 [Rhizonema sp. NSF051]|nr:hypothetical protein [Rhizonema sp. NSF051]